MWAAVYSVEIQDGRLPELAIGEKVTTDLSIYVESDSPPSSVAHSTQSTIQVSDRGRRALDTIYEIKGLVIAFEGMPKLWLVDTGDVILLPISFSLLPKPSFDWVGMRGAVRVSDYGYRDSPGYRTWTVRQIVLQHRPHQSQRADEIVEAEITAMRKWADAKEGYVSRYLLDLAV